MFDRESLIEDCKKAIAEDPTHKAVREIVARAVSDPAAALASLGEPEKGGVERIYVSPELTILNVIWAPRMTLKPHNHNMWAVIGVYTGREDNIFWRRLPEDADGRIEAAGADSLSPGSATPLGKDLIHSVTNPTDKLTSAIHVYGGDFFEEHRSEWDPLDLSEKVYDVQGTLDAFEKANMFLTH